MTLWPLVMHLAAEHGLGENTPSDGLGSIRASGAALVVEGGALTIKPGSCAVPAYMQYRTRYLAPHRDAVVQVLKDAAKWHSVAEPDGDEKALDGVQRHWYQCGEQIIGIVEKAEEG